MLQLKNMRINAAVQPVDIKMDQHPHAGTGRLILGNASKSKIIELLGLQHLWLPEGTSRHTKHRLAPF